MDTQEKYGLKKSNAIVLAVLMALTLVGFIAQVIELVSTRNMHSFIMCILYVLVIFYALYGYKVPHGNLMKVVILIYAYGICINYFTNASSISISAAAICLAVVLASFMAGRLDRLKQNNVIAGIIFLCLLVPVVANFIQEPMMNNNPAPMMEMGEEMEMPEMVEGEEPPQMMEGAPQDPNAMPGQMPQVGAPNGQPELIQPQDGGMGNVFSKVISAITEWSAQILWLAIMIAYYVRYHLHKEAGLQDKK